MFKKLWNAWKPIAKKIGDFQARLLLGLFYFLILGPFSLPVILLDPLSIRKHTSTWLTRTQPEPDTIERALRQS